MEKRLKAKFENKEGKAPRKMTDGFARLYIPESAEAAVRTACQGLLIVHQDELLAEGLSENGIPCLALKWSYSKKKSIAAEAKATFGRIDWLGRAVFLIPTALDNTDDIKALMFFAATEIDERGGRCSISVNQAVHYDFVENL